MTEEITKTDNLKPELPDLQPDKSPVAAAYEITRCTIGRHMGWKPLNEAPRWVRERLCEAQVSVSAGQLPMFFSDPQHDAFFFSVAILAQGGFPAPAMSAEIVRNVVHLCARFDMCAEVRGAQIVPRAPFSLRRWLRNLFSPKRQGVY